ncbi:MAG: SUMF1/EgtB/PvdO family nonheme iron enzyme [Myxococcota bacterium]
MPMIICPTCSFENDDGDDHCGRCGRPLKGITADRDEDSAPPKTASEPDSTASSDLGSATSRPLKSDKIPIRGGSITGDGLPAVSLTRSSEDTDLEDPWLTQKIQEAIERSEPSPIEHALQNATQLQLRVRPEPTRARNTLVEGLPAVKVEMLPPSERIPPPKPATASSPDNTPPSEGVVSQHAPSEQHPSEATEPEGIPRTITADELEPVKPKNSSNKAITGPIPATPQPPTPTPPTHPFNSFVPGMLIGILLGILITGVGAGILLRTQNTLSPNNSRPATDTETPNGKPPARTTIQAGPYLRGLSNDYRLMFAELCKKTAKEPDTECKEEIALRGEYPQKTMEVETFTIDTFEVSNDRWEACQKAGACPEIDYASCSNWTVQGLMPFGRVSNKLKRGDRPVVCLTRDEAAAYCTWSKGALPTQLQWEKAARGKDAYLFPWGTNWDPSRANWAERDIMRVPITGQLDEEELPAPVHSYPKGASPFGVLNMAGNVQEWVQPEADDDATTATARGGSWVSSPLDLRTTYRLFATTSTRRSDVGFRCAYTTP